MPTTEDEVTNRSIPLALQSLFFKVSCIPLHEISNLEVRIFWKSQRQYTVIISIDIDLIWKKI